MIKNPIVYRIAAGWHLGLEAACEALSRSAFMPCGPTQELSAGWIPPRGEENGALVESVAGQWIIKLQTERKSVPSDVLDREVKKRAAKIEEDTGRRPGKKERRDIKDEIKAALLPAAFPKRATILGWIDPAAGLLVVDASTQAKADLVSTWLVTAFAGFSVALLQTQHAPAGQMAAWLFEGEAPFDFSIDRDCELHASDASRAVVRYSRKPLDTEEVRVHIQAGMAPTKLAMTYDDRISFVLTDAGNMQRVEYLDVVGNNQRTQDLGAFDADVAIATGELARLLPALLEALGGEALPAPAPAVRVDEVADAGSLWEGSAA